MTPRELARLLRVSPDRIRAWIASGELPALNVARHRCGRPKYIIMPWHLAEWGRSRQAAAPPRPRRSRRRPAGWTDYYPDAPAEGAAR
jgi:excisionase family DNA binding protein